MTRSVGNIVIKEGHVNSTSNVSVGVLELWNVRRRALPALTKFGVYGRELNAETMLTLKDTEQEAEQKQRAGKGESIRNPVKQKKQERNANVCIRLYEGANPRPRPSHPASRRPVSLLVNTTWCQFHSFLLQLTQGRLENRVLTSQPSPGHPI